MRIHFKTTYDHDIRLFQDRWHAFWYVALIVVAIAAPFFLDEYYLGELTYVLVWALAGMGLMVLVGHAGQASLGHAAFLACPA